ncbi:hypothetical protein AMS64_22045 [Aeromonas veronii]|uniref:hypothetical protein n=1 Tax=Aeromonas veronii TaxID=654 RepID=UPI00078EF53C|nr:hypothetical protein [Aeromonas veronii]AMQ43668.1 hypothetical protein AMS64_15590 [Aeromonas veronii]AMQ43676.1 hypothetical protein AMS64_15655 [Aeromonas veronii]AMQ44842.1 hypothetical protein AMS64_22045 [Aeromonas veronii]MCX0428017.1 hypothetical protein [Aeromonas veronii]MCX0447290.1 hypothetical protein [Aeromonas veronii]
MIKDLRQQYRNAMAIIEQMKRGEWEFKGHYLYDFTPEFRCYTAERDNVELWLANGGFFCGVRDKPWELGIFGHLVWHFGAKQAKRALERKMRRQPSDMSGGAA